MSYIFLVFVLPTLLEEKYLMENKIHLYAISKRHQKCNSKMKRMHKYILKTENIKEARIKILSKYNSHQKSLNRKISRKSPNIWKSSNISLNNLMGQRKNHKGN